MAVDPGIEAGTPAREKGLLAFLALYNQEQSLPERYLAYLNMVSNLSNKFIYRFCSVATLLSVLLNLKLSQFVQKLQHFNYVWEIRPLWLPDRFGGYKAWSFIELRKMSVTRIDLLFLCYTFVRHFLSLVIIYTKKNYILAAIFENGVS